MSDPLGPPRLITRVSRACVMEPNDRERDARPLSKWRASISTIFWSALIWGVVVAVGAYLGMVAPKSEWMRSVFIRDVQEDTPAAFARRFLLGVAGGAAIGALLAIRDLRDKKGPNDD